MRHGYEAVDVDDLDEILAGDLDSIELVESGERGEGEAITLPIFRRTWNNQFSYAQNFSEYSF